MIEIRLICNQEKLTPAEKPIIASGDVNSVQLRVEFCQVWDKYAKSAVFFTDKAPTPIECPLLQNVCHVPAEVLAESGTFYIGIRGVNTNDTTAAVLTTDILGYRVVNGAPTGVEIGPTPDVYQQILTGYGKMDNFKQNKLSWVTDADIDAMFDGTYEGVEEEDPEGDGYYTDSSETDNSPFGAPYASAAQSFDLNKEGTVRMFLFATVGGYDAVVTGEGSIWNHSAPKQETPNPNGLIDVTITDNREYSKYVDQIHRLHIAAGITSIGAHFMHGAYNLKHLIFEDSAQITHLGVNAFAETQISGRYEFPNLEDETLAGPFESCPKLEGLTFSSNVKTITARSFGLCLALRYVDGLTGVTKIEDAAFMYCTSLERLEVIPEQVRLGNFAFILTPNDAAADGVALSTAAWADQDDLCFVQNEWGDQLDEIQRVTAEAVALSLPESDEQVTDFYHQWGVFPMIYLGQWYTGGHRASGCCGIFCLYHIYNIRHPNAQYDTFYDFIQNEIAPKKIKVTQELRDALEATPNGQILLAKRPGVYEVGEEITALDLPMALDDDTRTWGEIGTAHWGICEVLGWSAKENLFGEYDEAGTFQADPNSGTTIKQLILDELHAGRPVWLEIVAAHGIGHQGHAVTAIGYDKEKGLQIIDSGGSLPADTLPLVYWLPFEALITPHEKSAVWTIDFGEEITMYSIDNKLEEIAKGISFRRESGTGWSYNGSNLVSIPCSPNPKLVIFQASDATAAAVAAKVAAEADENAPYTVAAVLQSLRDLDGASLAHSNQKNSMGLMYRYYYGMAVPDSDAISFENLDTVPQFLVIKFLTEYQNAAGETVPAEYNWTAYYWDE